PGKWPPSRHPGIPLAWALSSSSLSSIGHALAGGTTCRGFTFTCANRDTARDNEFSRPTLQTTLAQQVSKRFGPRNLGQGLYSSAVHPEGLYQPGQRTNRRHHPLPETFWIPESVGVLIPNQSARDPVTEIQAAPSCRLEAAHVVK